jgi:hypothetical protein
MRAYGHHGAYKGTIHPQDPASKDSDLATPSGSTESAEHDEVIAVNDLG